VSLAVEANAPVSPAATGVAAEKVAAALPVAGFASSATVRPDTSPAGRAVASLPVGFAPGFLLPEALVIPPAVERQKQEADEYSPVEPVATTRVGVPIAAARTDDREEAPPAGERLAADEEGPPTPGRFGWLGRIWRGRW
jgi:hypothetical protein